MDVLVIGSGAREHCICWKLNSGGGTGKIYAVPGNPGISQLARCRNLGTGPDSFKYIADFALEKQVGCTIVGPEAPLADGIVDYFNSRGLRIFGPDKKAAAIECSKVFTKQLCLKYNIPTASSITFERSQYQKALSYIENLKEDDFPIVLKADGLAAGKGVIIPQTKQNAVREIQNCFIEDAFGSAGDRLIIEKFISGFEVSVLCLCDGKNILPMALAQDYKKIFDDDKGKNTGGMGSYSPVPSVDAKLYKKILEQIIYPTYDGLLNEGIDYRGILYGGIMVSGNEPLLLEYNCRFGDPETQAILPRLDSDLLEVLVKCADGKLGSSNLKWDNSKSVCVVLASRGYPETSSKDDLICGLDILENNRDVAVFHAGTKSAGTDIKSAGTDIYTNGGRVLSIAAKGHTFKDARKKVYTAISNIKFEGMQYRKDIALKVEEEN
jgi:phosphoribosylamine---glycine ligase